MKYKKRKIASDSLSYHMSRKRRKDIYMSVVYLLFIPTADLVYDGNV